MGLIDFSFRHRRFLFGGLILSLFLLAPAGAMAASSRRIGTKPPVPSGATAVGALPQATHLGVTVTLQPRDPAALAAYATAVSTPGSSVYHQYLSVSQFAQRFGPTPANIAAAEASIRAQGLTPGRLAPNGLSFQVSASAGRLASAFNTHFERYRLRGGRTAYANTSAPQVTGQGASAVQAVIGLDNLSVRRPEGLTKPGAGAARTGAALPRATSNSVVTPCSAATATGTLGGYTADQIASAYGFNSLYSAGDLGQGETVALYELEPYAKSDVSAYQSCYGTGAAVTNVNIDSAPTKCSNSATNCGIEDVLDIEDVIGLIPSASIRVYEGPNSDQGAYDTYAQIVNDNLAKVISTSWGLCESQAATAAVNTPTGSVGTPAAENTLFEQAATQGQSVFAAAGDNGTQDCTNASGNPTGGRAVDDPASQPYVTGVGGTSLPSGGPETVWNDGTSGGSGGGGVSTLWPAQPYQSGFAQSQSSISCGSGGTACREVPDVSADADPNTGYAIYFGGSWGIIGGTSAAAPTWASLIALADASSACSSSPIGFANPGLYAAARTSYASDFNDIISGNNSLGSVTGYSAGTGYDMASGLGSPIGSALVSTMCATTGDSVSFPANSAPPTETATAGQKQAVKVVILAATTKLSNPSITYSAFGLPPGLSFDPTTRTISGTPTTPGTYNVAVQAKDADGMVDALFFTWKVVPPVVTVSNVPSSLSGRVGVPVHTAALSSTDSVSAPITYSATGLPAGLSINRSTGVISGTPTRPASTIVTVKASDSYGGSASRQFRFVVAGAPRISASKLHISGAKGSLSLTLRAGQYAPSLKKVELIVPRGARLAGGRTPGKYVNAFTLGGKRQTISRRLSGGKLFVTLKSALSGAQLRLTGPELTFSRSLASGLSHRTKTVKLSLLLTDAAGTLTRLTLTLR